MKNMKLSITMYLHIAYGSDIPLTNINNVLKLVILFQHLLNNSKKSI